VKRRFGAHMMIAGGLHKAITSGQEVGCDVVQIFTKSPQQWQARPLTQEECVAFQDAQQSAGIPCVAAHDTYLINPAGADLQVLARSRSAMVDELERARLLGIPSLVMHLGARGTEPEDEALARLVESVRLALEQTPDDGPTLLLEITAGQGTCLGHRFEHIAHVLAALDFPSRLAVCLDTCHIFAAGYDLRTADAYAATMAEFDRIIGLHRVRLVHANDSKRELGSRVDRHAAIGRGEIGEEGFRLLVNDPRIDAPIVLETPKEGDMDRVNLAVLRSLLNEQPAGVPESRTVGTPLSTVSLSQA
jgi:deoxyribonuclease-4